MQTLREELESQLWNWRQDLSAGWQEFFGEVEPDFAAVDGQ